ncbi:hypothetical protein F5Y19DRAFT_251972 [Xylariaceae sp. FL1651]|nr:hypothetical protein F5Y19DRAFT_251972 [Xylariaceae sp. FL1651]
MYVALPCPVWQPRLFASAVRRYLFRLFCLTLPASRSSHYSHWSVRAGLLQSNLSTQRHHGLYRRTPVLHLLVTALTVVLQNATIAETRVTSAVTVPRVPRTIKHATGAAKLVTSAVTAHKLVPVRLVVVVRAELKSVISAVKSVTSLATALMPTVATPTVAAATAVVVAAAAATVADRARRAIPAVAMDTCLASV